jgi:hypothetical protein
LLSRGKVDQGTSALLTLRQSLDVRQEVRDILASMREEEEAITQELLQSGGQSVNSNPLQTTALSPAKGGVRASVESLASSSQVTSHGFGSQPSLRALLQRPSAQRALILACMLQAGQQLCGINTVMYYGASIFTMDGVSAKIAIWLTVGLAICNCIGSCLSSYFQDRLGRRLLTLWSMSAVSFSLAVISISFWATPSSVTDSNNSGDGIAAVTKSTWLLFVSICLYLLCYSSGMGSTPWTICAEIFPASVRGSGNSVSTGTNWISAFVVSISFLSIIKATSASGAFMLYSIVSFGLFIFYYKYLPETGGIELESMKSLLDDDAMWGHQSGCCKSKDGRGTYAPCESQT